MKYQVLVLLMPVLFALGCQKSAVTTADLPTVPGTPEAPKPGESQPTPKPGDPVVTNPPIDWSQPPVACPEETIPHKAQRECLDLSGVTDVYLDWPFYISESDKLYWQSQPRGQTYCRAMELLRRESLKPGTYKAGEIESAWMRSIAVDDYDQKVAAVYQASGENGMPTQVLTGALFQESLFSNLGIAEDGGNYSCGIGQTNLSEWCNWAIKQSEETKTEMRFPHAMRNCNLASDFGKLMKPFYDLALRNLKGTPEYKLMPRHFDTIEIKDVESKFPPADPIIQQVRFDLVKSFLGNCTDAHDGIMAKANQLALIYKNYVPEGLKTRDQYQPGQSYGRVCRAGGNRQHYPLSTGWLLAVGAYNAGPRAVDALAFYNGWTAAQMKDPATFDGFNPIHMVESFYWGGWYSAVDDKIHFIGRNGQEMTWNWFKGCVLQRHIARVAQHTSLPGVPKYIDSLENGISCKNSSTDPATGKLIPGTPDFRRVSSGRKPGLAPLPNPTPDPAPVVTPHSERENELY